MQQHIAANWTQEMQADYDRYFEEQLRLRKQEEAYRSLSDEEKKADEAAFKDQYKVTTLSLEDFKKSDGYNKLSEADQKAILGAAANTGSVTIVSFKSYKEAADFAIKHGCRLIKIPRDPALDSEASPPLSRPRMR